MHSCKSIEVFCFVMIHKKMALTKFSLIQLRLEIVTVVHTHIYICTSFSLYSLGVNANIM